MTRFYVFLYILCITMCACKTEKSTTVRSSISADVEFNHFQFADSLHKEFSNSIHNFEFDSIKIQTTQQNGHVTQQTVQVQPAIQTTATVIYGGKFETKHENAVVDISTELATDSLNNNVNNEVDETQDVQQVAVGEPPNMFFLYLFIIVAVLLYLYLKFK